MSKKAILDANEGGGRFTIYHEANGQTYVESRQKVDHIIKAASILADETPGKDFRHAAFIPEAVLNQAMIEGWFGDKDAWKRWANDPANACYRTWKGRM